MEQKNNKYYSYISEYYAANPTKFEKRKNNVKPMLYYGLAGGLFFPVCFHWQAGWCVQPESS